jgi:hypothetical protein
MSVDPNLEATFLSALKKLKPRLEDLEWKIEHIAGGVGQTWQAPKNKITEVYVVPSTVGQSIYIYWDEKLLTRFSIGSVAQTNTPHPFIGWFSYDSLDTPAYVFSISGKGFDMSDKMGLGSAQAFKIFHRDVTKLRTSS